MYWVFALLKEKWVIWCLLVINILGTIYGYYWYKSQLAETPAPFLLFVPDSPTASLFFCFVLIAFLFGRNVPLFEALAAVSLFKYGIWAVGMNIAGSIVGPPLNWMNYMLIFSHLGMAAEGLLYAPFYKIQPIHLVIASIWVLHNEMIDYVFKMMPHYYMLEKYMPLIGYITFWLSILSVAIVYLLTRKKHIHKKAE